MTRIERKRSPDEERCEHGVRLSRRCDKCNIDDAVREVRDYA